MKTAVERHNRKKRKLFSLRFVSSSAAAWLLPPLKNSFQSIEMNEKKKFKIYFVLCFHGKEK